MQAIFGVTIVVHPAAGGSYEPATALGAPAGTNGVVHIGQFTNVHYVGLAPLAVALAGAVVSTSSKKQKHTE